MNINTQQIIQMSKQGADQAENRAKRTLIHYMRMMMQEAGLGWNGDNQTEVEGIVEDIINSAALKATAMTLSQLELKTT